MVLVLKGLIVLQRSIQLQLLQHYSGWGIGLDYRDIEWFALGTNRDHSLVLRLYSVPDMVPNLSAFLF